MNKVERKAMIRLREVALETLYSEPRYSRWGHVLAAVIHDADVALGDTHYADLRARYPGPRPAKARAA